MLFTCTSTTIIRRGTIKQHPLVRLSHLVVSVASAITYDGVYGMCLHVVEYRNYAGSKVEGRGLKGGVALALM